MTPTGPTPTASNHKSIPWKRKLLLGCPLSQNLPPPPVYPTNNCMKNGTWHSKEVLFVARLHLLLQPSQHQIIYFSQVPRCLEQCFTIITANPLLLDQQTRQEVLKSKEKSMWHRQLSLNFPVLLQCPQLLCTIVQALWQCTQQHNQRQSVLKLIRLPTHHISRNHHSQRWDNPNQRPGFQEALYRRRP